MSQPPNQYLVPLTAPRRGRTVLRRTTDLWPKAAHVMISQRPRLNTKSLAAVRVSQKALGDVWWPFLFDYSGSNLEAYEKTLVLWLNSTLGLLMLFGHREETEGAFVQYKKPVLTNMPVLDVRTLHAEQLDVFTSLFDQLSNTTLRPFPHIEHDHTRQAIDAAFSATFDIPQLANIPPLLAREPFLSLDLTRLIPPLNP